jgi:hypothetical protein
VSARLAWEARATALFRRHAVLLGGVVLGTLVIIAVVARSRGAERPAAIPGVLGLVAVLAPAILAHGAVSTDLRSGVALLWLQKPVDPIRFYLLRGLEVLGLSVVIVLTVSGAGALLATLLAGPETGHVVMTAIPLNILFAASTSVLAFAFSAWGTSLDALLAFFVFYFSGVALAEPGLLRDVLAWVGFPLESAATITRYFSLGETENLAWSLARVLVFLTTWTLLAGLGLLVTTRSPLPTESAR